MTRIRMRCTSCGWQLVPPSAVTIHDDGGDLTARSRCVECHDLIVMAVTRYRARKMEDVGVVRVAPLPPHPEHPTPGVLTADDLLDAHEALQTGAFRDELEELA